MTPAAHRARSLPALLAAALVLGLVAGLARPAGAMDPAEVVFEESTFEGFTVLTHMPDAPTALLFLFHGSNGDERFARRFENREILARLVPLGYGVVATASTLREDPKRWATQSVDPAENVDLARLGRLHASLVADGTIRAGTPVFAMGMSNGAAFAGVFGMAAQALGLPVRALALYEGPLVRPVLAEIEAGRPLPPLFAVLAENDPLVRFEPQMSLFSKVAEAGYTVDLHIARERPFRVEDLSRLPEFGEAEAREIFDRLVSGGIIDADGKRLFSFEGEARGLQDALDAALDGVPGAGEVRNQLLIAWASHKMRSDFAEAQVAFFETYRTVTDE
ncbi:MAG: hypothetical protein HXY25_07245 [Alphaproteobacteria bacterium]|nr:hypothetical protein [Alphaproteobacteria bacterium]